METNDEYRRVPKGLFDREGTWVQRKLQILSAHYQCGLKIGCELLELSPLGFASTFKKASFNSGEKVYKLIDRSDRELFLACDSTPGVLRYFCEVAKRKPSVRIGFIAPVFRYRNRPVRHFTQIGYSIINEVKPQEIIDFPLLQLIDALVKLFRAFNIEPDIHLNDFQYLRRKLQEGGVPEVALPDILHTLQFSTLSDRRVVLQNNIADEKILKDLLGSLTEPEFPANERLLEMAKAVRKLTNCNVVIDTTNLHSVETISSLAVRFKTKDGKRLGDGGRYDDYGRRFDKCVETLCSVATGIETLIDNSVDVSPDIDNRKLLLINIGTSENFLIDTMKKLAFEGYSIVYSSNSSKLQKAILRAIEHSFQFISFVGEREELNRELQVKNLIDKSVSLVKL